MLTLPDDSDEDGDGDARLVVVPLEIAQWLAQKPGLATSILVAPEAADAGRELDVTLAVRLQRDLGARYLVLPAAVRADELRRAVAPLSSFATFCALLALVVGASTVFNTTSMSLRRDLPQIGLLLAIGDDSHRIAMRAVALAWTLGILGSALGLISGVWIGVTELVAAVPAVLQGVHTGGVHLALHPWPFALSLACGILSATAGALLPSLAMLQVGPHRSHPRWARRPPAAPARIIVLRGAGRCAGRRRRTRRGCGIRRAPCRSAGCDPRRRPASGAGTPSQIDGDACGLAGAFDRQAHVGRPAGGRGRAGRGPFP